MKSYGRYERWSGKKQDVPQVVEFTRDIQARLDCEFGFVLHITGGHGEELQWEIDHPPWRDAKGRPVPAFKGSFHVRGNTFDFFLGDTVWEPIAEKCGIWTLSVWHNKQLLAKEQFALMLPTEDE